MPILIIPGLNGSEPQHWQSLWEADIADARRVHQADWSNPDRDLWLARLVEEVKRSPGAILVGHSLGATLIAHLAELHPERARVIANLWEASFVDAGDAGHLNVASGHGAWPEGRLLLDRLRAPRGYLRPQRPAGETHRAA